MNIHPRIIAVSALALALSSTAALAGDASDIRALSESKISLVQAIQAAEKSQSGRAIDAGIDDDSFTPTYEVSVVKDNNTVFDVRVDAVSGKVLGAREDIDD